MNYQEILEYDKQQAEIIKELHKPIDDIEEAIRKAELRLSKLREKLEKTRSKFYKKREKIEHHWTDTILGSIAKELISRHPDKFNQYEQIGVFGLNCEAPLWFYNDDKKSHDTCDIKASLTFMPLRNGVQVWTGKLDNRYEEGSLGAMNGDNLIMEEVTSIEQLESYLIKSYNNHIKEEKKNENVQV